MRMTKLSDTGSETPRFLRLLSHRSHTRLSHHPGYDTTTHFPSTQKIMTHGNPLCRVSHHPHRQWLYMRTLIRSADSTTIKQAESE